MRLMDPSKYGNAFAKILGADRVQVLGPGKPNDAARGTLEALTVESAFDGFPVADDMMGLCCVSAAWLYHDFLHDSHRLSQRVDTPTGSYWHGIMHRREPDASNSMYWFRRVGRHPIFPHLRDEVARIASATAPLGVAEFLVQQEKWDPYAFTELCEAARVGRNNRGALCEEIQTIEFELLFDFSFRLAVGG